MTTAAARITEDELDRVRSRIGQAIEIVEVPYLTETSLDGIRLWSPATGDRNPLYFDADVAAVRLDHRPRPACRTRSAGYRSSTAAAFPECTRIFGGSHWR